MTKHQILALSTSLSLCIAIGCESPETDALDADLPGGDSSSSDDGSDPEGSPGDAQSTGDPPGPRLPQGTTDDVDESSSTDAPDVDPDPDDVPLPLCGDGVIDADEECDDGDANSWSGACLGDCTVAFCGDGQIQDGVESCDDGDANNELAVGACAPDCSRVIASKTITVAELSVKGGDLGEHPVKFADAHCESNALAMFVYPGGRQATTIPMHDIGAVDWVIQPFTAYENADGELLWITGPVPLLGVRYGQQHPLLAAVESSTNTTAQARRMITGIVDGWVTASDDTCAGWQSTAAGYEAQVGRPDQPDSLLDTGVLAACDEQFAVYCVEQ